MRFIVFALALLCAIACADWVLGPENFEGGVIFDHSGSFPAYWFAPTYHTPLYVYSPGFESDSAVGSGPMTWSDWWGNFVRSPLTKCSSADSVILIFRMLNTGRSGDYARFYGWVELSGYYGTTTLTMTTARNWEEIAIDFTEYAAGQSQVYFYLEGNFANDSYTHEVKFDNIGVSTRTALDIDARKSAIPAKLELSIFPNPFNSSCAIVAPPGARIDVYDLRGKRICTGNIGARHSCGQMQLIDAPLENASPLQTAFRRFVWRPDETIASGIYLVKATTEDGGTAISRIVLAR